MKFLAFFCLISIVAGRLSTDRALPKAKGCPACTPDSNCAWGFVNNPEGVNVAYPDKYAIYYLQAFKDLKEGDSIIIEGEFPGARYSSFVTYNADGSQYSASEPVSSLYDALWSKTSGTNYFTSDQPAPLPPTGTYKLTVTAGDKNLTAGVPAGGTGNPVLAAPYGVPGYLIYRLYAPYTDPNADDFYTGGVPLPTLTMPDGEVLCSCGPMKKTTILLANLFFGWVLREPIQSIPAPIDLPAFGYNQGGSFFANPDNKYLQTVVTNVDDEFLIVTAVAPTFPNTNAHAIVQDPPTQVRYWSMCTNLVVLPGPYVDCYHDADTTLFQSSPDTLFGDYNDADVAGTMQYAYVTAGEAYNPGDALPEGFTFIASYFDNKLGNELKSKGNLMLMRNMLPDPEFKEAIQQIPINFPGDDASTDPSSAKATMGIYYPLGLRCKIDVFLNAAGESGTVQGVIKACKAASMSRL